MERIRARFNVSKEGRVEDVLLPVIRDMYAEYIRILQARNDEGVNKDQIERALVQKNLDRLTLQDNLYDRGVTPYDITDKIEPEAKHFYESVLNCLHSVRQEMANKTELKTPPRNPWTK